MYDHRLVQDIMNVENKKLRTLPNKGYFAKPNIKAWRDKH